MQMDSPTTRLRIGIAFVVALAAVATLATFAGAVSAGVFPRGGFDPEDTNVPYLAWRGEQVRLVKCFTQEELARGGALNGFPVGTFVIEDWSGDPHQRPQFEDNFLGVATAGPFEGIGEEAGKLCFAQDIVSLKPGIAIVKLTVTPQNEGLSELPAAKHQFMVAWMSINNPANVEDIGPLSVPATEPPAALCEQVVEFQCVDFTVRATPETTAAALNQVQVTVKGTIPMEGNFDELNAQMGRAAGTPLTLPDDWALWAQTSLGARTSAQGSDHNPCLWDIHDEFTGVPGGGATPVAGDNHTQYPTASDCTVGPSAPGKDEVDSGAEGGGDEFGPFTRFVHSFALEVPAGVQPVGTTIAPQTFPFTIGPFDPKRRDTSYIPDGYLNEGDAPMPSVRVDAGIGANSGAPGDISGVGMLVPVDKHAVYNANEAHPLWAPYYGAFIPATAAERCNNIDLVTAQQLDPNFGLCTTASGIDGPAKGNNFEGFLVNSSQGGLYHYWDFTFGISRGTPDEFTNPITDLTCPPFAQVDFDTEFPPPLAGPTGISTASAYTDEHGEVRFGFAPGINFFFGNLPIVFNANNGCDIQGISPLGTATISAIARYPYQPVTAADVPGDETVTKTVTSAFNKQITCAPKGPGLANQVGFICTATAIGIDNTPFVNETVCFISNVEGIMAGGPTVTPPNGLTGAAVLCELTNDSGQASIEIFGKGDLNVIAFFVDEGLLRFIQLSPPTTVSVPGPSTGTQTVVTSTQAPTNSQIVSVGGKTVPTQKGTPAAQKKAQLLSARLVYSKSGRKLVVRVKSTKAKAKIRVVMRGLRGKTIATAVRTVRTNRAVQVPNLKIVRSVNRVSVSVLS